MNLMRSWSVVAVTGAVFSSSAFAHADRQGPETAPEGRARAASPEDKTAFFGLCWPFCGYNRGCGYGYGGCSPCGYGGYGAYGGGYCPRPACGPCGPVGGYYGGYGGCGYGAGYGYGGYGGCYSPTMYPAPAYAPPACGLPSYGAPCYQGMGYNTEESERPASTPSYTARRRNTRPAFAEEDSPFFQ